MHSYQGHPQNVYSSGPDHLHRQLDQLTKEKNAHQMQYQQRGYSQTQRPIPPEHMTYQHTNQQIYEGQGAKTYIGQQNILAQNVTMTSKEYSYSHSPHQPYPHMPPQDAQIYLQPNQQMSMISQQPSIGKQQLDQFQVMENHYPAQSQIGQTMRTNTQQIHHGQNHRNQGMPLYDQNQHQRYMTSQQAHPHHQMNQSRQSNRVDRPMPNQYLQNQGHQGSERNDMPQQQPKSVMVPQSHQAPQYHPSSHNSQSSAPPQNYNNISAMTNQVTIPLKMSRQQHRPEQMMMPSQSQNTSRQSMPMEEGQQPMIMTDTNKVTIEEDYVDPDTLSQKQNQYQEHSTASFQDKSIMQTSQNNLQSTYEGPQQLPCQSSQINTPQGEIHNIQSQQSFQQPPADELENTYDNVEQNIEGVESAHESGENEYTTIQDCFSQHYETRQEMPNDNSQMIYDQSFPMSQCSNESPGQDNFIDDQQDQGYDGDTPLDKSQEIIDHEDLGEKPLDELLEMNTESNRRESQNNKQNYNNFRGPKNKKQALSQNSYDHDKYEDDGLDQNQEKKNDEQYLTVDDGNVSASRVSHFQESFGRAPQNSNGHNNVSTVSLGKESGTFFQNKEGYHKSSAPENSASFGDLDNHDNGEDASRSKLQLTDEDQTIDPNLEHQEQAYQEGNQDQFSIGDNDDQEVLNPQQENYTDEQEEYMDLPYDINEFMINEILNHSEPQDDGLIYFLCLVEFTINNELDGAQQLKDYYWIPHNRIMDSYDDAQNGPLSQDCGDINNNKVHLKFYCSTRSIDLEGIDKIKDLIDKVSSNEKSQDQLLQEEMSPEPNIQQLEVTQEIWTAKMQSNQKSTDQQNSDQGSEDPSPYKKSSKRRKPSKRVENSSPEKSLSNHQDFSEHSSPQQDDDEYLKKTRSGRISKKPTADNGYHSDISTLRKAKRAPKLKSSQRKGRQRRHAVEDDEEDQKSQETSEKISDSGNEFNLSQDDGNVTEFENPYENNFYYDNNDDDQSNIGEDEKASNSSGGEYISNVRNQTTIRNQNQLGFGSEPVYSSSQKQNQENSKDDDDDTVSIPQRRSSTRKKSRRDQIDEGYMYKRKTGSKRKHGYDDGYKTQPYEPNSPVQQDEDLDDGDQGYMFEEGEKPRKIGAWQVAAKFEFNKNYEQAQRRKSRIVLDDAEIKDQQRQKKIAQSLIQKRDNIQGNFADHEPIRIINFKRTQDKKLQGNQSSSAWNEFEDQEYKMNFNPNNYPYHEVMCKVEWAPLKIQSETITIQNSQVPYKELREKAPHLLCEFFERHMKLK